MQAYKYLLFLSMTVLHPLHPVTKRRGIDSCHTHCTELKNGPVTIFIHGTVFPVISRFTHHDPNRRGLYRYTADLTHPVRGKERLAKVLHEAAPLEFPAHSFYKFYWSGNLTCSARKDASKELFHILEKHSGPVTIIAHSHGCNVALYLAEFVQQKKSLLSIDRLILLAAPVQRTTSPLVCAPLFKRVYSLYSTADGLQVADPQGIYEESKHDKKQPLFSERIYPTSPNLVQARLLIGRRSPSHIDFILDTFFKQIPSLLHLLDKEHNAGNNHLMVDIPSCGHGPKLLTFTSSELPYKTRKKGRCSCLTQPLKA